MKSSPTESTDEIESGEAAGLRSVKVWDLFVRVFHWLLVITFATAWYTGGIWDQPHLAAGYLVLALVLARIVWGFVGSRYALFSAFVYRPRVIVRYMAEMLRMRTPRYLGHNPAGGAMVIALLAILLVLCITGIMMTTDAFWGVEWVDNLHATASNIALVLVALHVGGVVFASVEHGENLVRAMITGIKRSR
ncbi:cytochrome b/b6 domain-containing protein [Hyphomicrobium sp. 99]|uniref:cytochrome b/b6 domain-containing protein n=1 Tax=Hyphomicrobium sp. 99 TaxID=1163419 RepID=UPI0005F7BF98|nr:cytochrome b/b6 domain-containing protein [Hyphomicrobium sp. 99]